MLCSMSGFFRVSLSMNTLFSFFFLFQVSNFISITVETYCDKTNMYSKSFWKKLVLCPRWQRARVLSATNPKTRLCDGMQLDHCLWKCHLDVNDGSLNGTDRRWRLWKKSFYICGPMLYSVSGSAIAALDLHHHAHSLIVNFSFALIQPSQQLSATCMWIW